MSTTYSRRALLLNSSYEPLKVISWQKALILWFQGKVEIIEYHSFFIRTVSQKVPLPSILRLKTFVKNHQNPVRFCREHVYLRDNYTCQYCGKKGPQRDLTLDHVIPVSKLGDKSWNNMVTACRACNQKKANRTPKTANMPLLKEPRVPVWLPVIELEMKQGFCPESWTQYLPKKAV